MKILLPFLAIIILGCTNSDEIVPTIVSQPSTTETAVNTAENTTMDFSNQKLLLEGKFQTGVHSTSGTAKIYEDKSGKRTLVFDNFKTDSGPDLRIYIANDKAIVNFTELSNKVENGNKTYEIPAKVDLAKQKFIVIWCKQFAVLFGHAELK